MLSYSLLSSVKFAIDFFFAVLSINFDSIDAFMNVSCIFIHFTLSEKCPSTEFFLVHIFPHSDWDTPLSLRIQSKCGKTRTGKKLCIWKLFTQCIKIDLSQIFHSLYLKSSMVLLCSSQQYSIIWSTDVI